MFFSKKISASRLAALLNMMGFVEGNLPTWYLGTLVTDGRVTSRMLNQLVEKVKNKVAGWKGRLLSQGGKLILLKDVLCSMPTHLLTVLDVPKIMLGKLNSILSSFFWGDSKRRWCS